MREFLEVEDVRLVEKNTTTSPQNSLRRWMHHNLLKRSGVVLTLYLYVDVNIFPVDYTDGSIALSKSVSRYHDLTYSVPFIFQLGHVGTCTVGYQYCIPSLMGPPILEHSLNTEVGLH